MRLRAVVMTMLFLSAMLDPTVVEAQRGQQASIAGTVTDDTGAVLPGARVTIGSPQLIGGARSHVADERGTYRYLSGAPYPRITNAFGAQTGAFTINLEPVGAYQLPAQNSADLRVDKTVRLGGPVRAEVFLDIFNVNNQGGAWQVNNVSGSAFGQPRAWMAARQFRGGVRVVF